MGPPPPIIKRMDAEPRKLPLPVLQHAAAFVRAFAAKSGYPDGRCAPAPPVPVAGLALGSLRPRFANSGIAAPARRRFSQALPAGAEQLSMRHVLRHNVRYGTDEAK